MVGLSRTRAAKVILDALVKAHSARPFVGGLFHAYEKAMHFLLLTGLYRRGLWRTAVERSYPSGSRAKCDLVVPLEGEGALWLEAKLIWLARGNGFPYWTADKYLASPLDDWRRLAGVVGAGNERAVLVLLGWDDHPGSRASAVKWRADMERRMNAPRLTARALRPFPAPKGGEPQVLRGELLIWSSLEGH